MKLNVCCAYKHVHPRATPSMAAQYFRQKDKVVFIMGPTGTGKSRLAIDLATRYPAEIINCDKIQVHRGLDVVTNKVTKEECRGIPHHLLGTLDPKVDLTADEFTVHASGLIDSLVMRGRLPIVVGGSTSYIQALATSNAESRLRYDCCFLWVDVSMPILYSFVSRRVDRMVQGGLVEEVRNVFDFNNHDYSQGIRRAIGVPELDFFFRNEAFFNEENRARVLDNAISKIKENTCLLAYRQLQKISRLHSQWYWSMHRLDATEVFLRSGDDADEAWEKLVAGPSASIVNHFLRNPGLVPSLLTASEMGKSAALRAMVASAGSR